MKSLVILIPLLFSSLTLASEPSLTIKKIGSLGIKVSSVADLKKAIGSQRALLQKLLVRDGTSYRITFKEGDANDILSGAISFKDLTAEKIDFIWTNPLVSTRPEGPAFQVRVPMIAKKSYGIVQEDRFLVKLVPQMGSTSGTQTSAGSTIVTAYRFQFSEVEASTLQFLVDRDGTVFSLGI